jgi:Uma2 family endonuclease
MARTRTATITEPMTYEDYLKTPETNSIEELHYGFIVREEPDGRWHQDAVMWLAHLLFTHVRQREVGHVSIAPIGVVLDREKALVLSPDILVVLPERFHLLRDGKVQGAPNLVVEVASPSTRRRDRTKKVDWYRTYGAEECWLVDGRNREIELFDFRPDAAEASRMFRGDEPFRTRVLPDFLHPTCDLFDRYVDAMYARVDPERSSYDKDQT